MVGSKSSVFNMGYESCVGEERRGATEVCSVQYHYFFTPKTRLGINFGSVLNPGGARRVVIGARIARYQARGAEAASTTQERVRLVPKEETILERGDNGGAASSGCCEEKCSKLQKQAESVSLSFPEQSPGFGRSSRLFQSNG